ncbi:N-acetyltransferase [Paenibacillaceae bacterium]|nr:N-acetyltransferase [Paenibacillaceae bacterium]
MSTIANFDESSELYFRNTELADLQFVLQLESIEDNKQYIVPWEKNKHESALAEQDKAHLIIVNRGTEQPVGFVIIAGLLNQNQSIELVRIVIHEKGKGYGRTALKMIKKRVFDQLHANRLWLDVKVNNHRAKQLYASEGFSLEGTLRECLKNDNQFESLSIMSLLKSEYETIGDFYPN